MLERLALIQSHTDNRLPELLADSLPDVPHGARVIVASTRAEMQRRLIESEPMREKPRQQRALASTVWLDVSDPQLADVFMLN